MHIHLRKQLIIPAFTALTIYIVDDVVIHIRLLSLHKSLLIRHKLL
jgi:hypothetical protein